MNSSQTFNSEPKALHSMKPGLTKAPVLRSEARAVGADLRDGAAGGESGPGAREFRVAKTRGGEGGHENTARHQKETGRSEPVSHHENSSAGFLKTTTRVAFLKQNTCCCDGCRGGWVPTEREGTLIYGYEIHLGWTFPRESCSPCGPQY